MAEFAAMRNLEVWYARLEVEKLCLGCGRGSPATNRKRIDKAMAKALGRDSKKAFSKLSQQVEAGPGSSRIRR